MQHRMYATRGLRNGRDSGHGESEPMRGCFSMTSRPTSSVFSREVIVLGQESCLSHSRADLAMPAAACAVCETPEAESVA